MTDMSELVFEVTTEPPVDRRPRGPGRPRSNRFDDAVKQSFEEKWAGTVSEDAPRGKWFRLRGITDEKKAKQLEAQIRSAAKHWENYFGTPVGANVHWDPDTGILQFRGCEKSQGDKAASDDGNAESVDEASVNEAAGTEDAEIRDEELAEAPA